MGQLISEIMTTDPITVPTNATVAEAARLMREHAIGDVLVVDGDRLCGVVTDRDVVNRIVAEDRPAGQTPIGDICSTDPVAVRSDHEVSEAIALMRKHDIRRLPVVDDSDRPAGIVTLGDLAENQDPNSVLGDISAAPPNPS